MSAPVFYCPDVSAPTIELEGPEGHHAAVVRRVRVGEEVDLTDGVGTVAACTVTSVSRTGIACEVRSRRTVPRPAPELTVVQALPKGDRGELAVELMTEVGVDRVVPWSAARCVTRWRGDRGTKALTRWRSTAREAAKQSRRAWLPEVTDLASTAAVCTLLAEATLPVVLHEAAAGPVTALPVPESGRVTVVVGPEGGITDEELAAFADAGAHVVRMGPTVLRTSTAGATAAAALLSRTRRWS